MMKKKPLACLLVLLVITLHIPPLASQADWTVMIYMDGDNNLESAAIDDFNELEVAGSTANVNIVVQIDRIPGYDSTNGNWTSTKRYHVDQDPNGYDNIIISTEISDIGEANMGHPTTLADFVNWARTTYPATNYLLVLWDHGDGWKTRSAHVEQKGMHKRLIKREPVKGICYDDTNLDYLTLPDVDTALNTATTGGVFPIHVVGFDACLMAMLEIGYEISPYSSYMVASEESERTDGWDYEATMMWLTANPASTPSQLASQIVIDYMSFYGYGSFDTQSAVDLSQVTALATAVSTLASDLASNVMMYFYDIKDVRDQVQEYSDSDFIDLYHFAQLIQTEISDPQIQTDAQSVMDAVSTTVIQEGHGVGSPDSHGISIYFPYGVDNYLSRYETDTEFAADTLWDEFLNAYYSTVPPPIHEVAVIDDDNGRDLQHVETYYMGILDSLGVPYDYYDAGIHGSPDLVYLQMHSVVIWFTGSDFSTTLSPTDESNLMDYLDWGGKLFLSSQDYVWDLKLDGRYPSVFLRNYLHTIDEGEDTGVNSLTGVSGNEVGDGLGPIPMCWALRSPMGAQQIPNQGVVQIRKVAYNPNAADWSGLGYPDIPVYTAPLDPAPGLVEIDPNLLPNFQISDENFSGTCVPGDTITFYIEVYNGTGAPLSVTVQDDIPAGMFNASVAPPGIILDTNGDTIIGNAGDTVSWTFPNLPSGYTLLSYTADVVSDGSLNFGGTILNDNATIYYTDAGIPMEETASPVTILVQAAQLIKEPFKDLYCTLPASTVVDNNRLYYRLTVYNTIDPLSFIPFTATVTEISDTIPLNTIDPLYVSSPPGLLPQPIVGNTILWQGSTLLSPGTTTYGVYSVFVPAGSSGTITNFADLTYTVPFPPPGTTTVTTTSNTTETEVLTSCTFIDYADRITKDYPSEYAFFNEDTEYVAITHSGVYEMVFFAFRYEGISSIADRREVMQRILDFLAPMTTFGYLGDLFDTNTFFVAGDTAYCTDVLGAAKIAFALGQAGTLENPEGRTDLQLTILEHDTGNLIPIGGPAVNPVADEFDSYFGVTYEYQPGVSFEIFADLQSIYLDLTTYPQQDIAIIYLARHNNRYVMLVWGYGWEGTYAASVLLGDIANWDLYSAYHMIMLRWMDLNIDGLVQENEIVVEAST
jgi:hypothetical protein